MMMSFVHNAPAALLMQEKQPWQWPRSEPLSLKLSSLSFERGYLAPFTVSDA